MSRVVVMDIDHAKARGIKRVVNAKAIDNALFRVMKLIDEGEAKRAIGIIVGIRSTIDANRRGENVNVESLASTIEGYMDEYVAQNPDKYEYVDEDEEVLGPPE